LSAGNIEGLAAPAPELGDPGVLLVTPNRRDLRSLAHGGKPLRRFAQWTPLDLDHNRAIADRRSVVGVIAGSERGDNVLHHRLRRRAGRRAVGQTVVARDVTGHDVDPVVGRALRSTLRRAADGSGARSHDIEWVWQCGSGSRVKHASAAFVSSLPPRRPAETRAASSPNRNEALGTVAPLTAHRMTMVAASKGR
jgi:hypothetical protein